LVNGAIAGLDHDAKLQEATLYQEKGKPKKAANEARISPHPRRVAARGGRSSVCYEGKRSDPSQAAVAVDPKREGGIEAKKRITSGKKSRSAGARSHCQIGLSTGIELTGGGGGGEKRRGL